MNGADPLYTNYQALYFISLPLFFFFSFSHSLSCASLLLFPTDTQREETRGRKPNDTTLSRLLYTFIPPFYTARHTLFSQSPSDPRKRVENCGDGGDDSPSCHRDTLLHHREFLYHHFLFLLLPQCFCRSTIRKSVFFELVYISACKYNMKVAIAALIISRQLILLPGFRSGTLSFPSSFCTIVNIIHIYLWKMRIKKKKRKTCSRRN